jgi:hypothetical protein
MRRVITLVVIAVLAFAALAATAAARTESRFNLIETVKSGHKVNNNTFITHGVLSVPGDRDDIVGTDTVKFRRHSIHARVHAFGGTMKAQGNFAANRIVIVGGSGRWNGAAGKIKFHSLSHNKTLLRFDVVQ